MSWNTCNTSRKNYFNILKWAFKMFPISIHLDRRVNALFITSSVGKNMRTTTHNGVFPKWKRNSGNSGNLRNHWSMSLFKILSHPCLAGAVVASWSPIGEAAGSNPFNNKYVWIRWVEWNYLGVVRTWQQRHRLFMSSEMGCMATNITVHTLRQRTR